MRAWIRKQRESSEAVRFFSDSGWVLVATFLSGILMVGVHGFARAMPRSEYGVFFTLLQVVSLMSIPGLGLQSVFARRAAAAVTAEQEMEVISALKKITRMLMLVGVTGGLGLFLFADQVRELFQMNSSRPLIPTWLAALFAVWMPAALGALQGRQRFGWYGGSILGNGFFRLLGVFLGVYWIASGATGAMTGVAFGMIMAVGLAVWGLRDWRGVETVSVSMMSWLKEAAPLTIGFGSILFLMSLDMVFAQSLLFGDLSSYHGAAGMVGRGMVTFTAPIVAVMFPRLVKSFATSEKSAALRMGMLATLGLCGIVVLLMATIPQVPIQIIYGPSFMDAAKLIPWFGLGMAPLCLANPLISQALAIGDFRICRFALISGGGYLLTLMLASEWISESAGLGGSFRILWIMIAWNWFYLASVYWTLQNPIKRDSGKTFSSTEG